MSSSLSYFQTQAPRYLLDCSRGYRAWLKEQEWQAVLQTLGPRTFERILDLGSGPGWYSQRFHVWKPRSIWSVDQSPLMLDEITSPVHRKVVMDVEELQLNESFDLILCLGVMEFLQRPERAFHRALQHLTPGGSAVFLLPITSCGAGLYQRLHRRHGLTIQVFRKEQLEAWAGSHGLRLSAFKSLYGFNSVLVFERLP